ncbi:putative neurexin [Schistosoma mansoni]|uniref:putative neurexin n=1 Tax=Schistosoma mansoni TaxID=6183 RepID=UPI0001A94227|nr:putative neurexin [Schistosoma mansoni]|eukprot:XP_018647836.1 putative neurexin [Schistosoma mansoni]
MDIKCQQMKSNKGLPLKIAAFSGNGFILNKLKNRPITSTEERIEIEFQTKESNSSLFCSGSETQLLRLDMVNGLLKVFLHLPITETDIQLDLAEGNNAITQNHGIYRKNKLSNNSLVFTRLLGSPNYQRLYLLHTQIIVLGGSYKLGDIYQMNSMNIISDNNFIGFISKAIFQADALEMDILEFTLSSLHGFRIQSILPLTNKTYDQVNEINPYTTNNTTEPIQFIHICDLINNMNQMITSSISFNSTTILNENMFITLKLPTFLLLDLLQNSVECIQQNSNDPINLINTLKWINIEIQFSYYATNHNGLLFLLRDDIDGRLKHYSFIKDYNEQLSNEDHLDGNLLIGAEFRHNNLYLIIQKNKQIWFDMKLYTRSNQLRNIHKLHIKYTMIWLINENNHSLDNLWPLIKINYDDSMENWMTVGPNNHYSTNNGNYLTLINNEQELKLMKNLKVVNYVYEKIWENTLWFGRTLYLSGMNYTKSIENGLFIPGIQNIHNKYQHFQGCITRVTINGLRLDLQSAVQARIRYLQSIHDERIQTITDFSFPLKCNTTNNNVTTEMLSTICSSCSLNKQHHHVQSERLSNSYLHNSSELKECQQIVYNEMFGSNHDSFQILLVNGHIHVKYIVDNKNEVYELPVFLSDGKWHHFELIHNNSYITIHLDRNVFSQRTNLTITELPVQQIIIGSSNSYESSLLPINPRINQINGYNGDIAYFSYNGLELLSYKKNNVPIQYPLNKSNLENSFEFSLNQWVIEFTAQLFQYNGCIANFQFNGHPTINLLQMAKVYPNLDCNDYIVYGCEPMTSGCASSENKNNNISPFYSSFHDFDSSDDSKNVNMCYNDGKCLNRLNTFYCACDLTTFQGHQCDEVGTTLHFGKIGSINAHSFNPNRTLTNTKQYTGFVQFQIEHNDLYIINDIFTIGLQLDIKMLHHPDKLNSMDNDFITLLFTENQFQNNLTYLHVYLEQGYLKMKFLLDGSMIVIDGPKINVQDGYYHRIRGIRSRNQILLEVDQYQTVYRLYNEFGSLLKTRYLWLGHSPLSNFSDFIQGYVTGVYYNGLRLTDLASGLQHLTFVKVTRYAEVEYTNTFQLKLGPNSPFYTKSNLRKRKKQLQLSKSSSSIFSPLVISNGFLTDFNILNKNENKCLSCTTKNDFSLDPSPLIASSHSNTLLPNSKIQPTIITFTKSLNIWLFICLILTGLILISSFGFLIYRCTQNRHFKEYNTHISYYEQSTSTNEPNLLQSIENAKINKLDKQEYDQNNHFSQNQYQQNISLCHTGYSNNLITSTSIFLGNDQYMKDKIDTLPTSLYIDNETLSNLNETYTTQNRLQHELNNQQMDDYKLDRYVNVSNWSTIQKNHGHNSNGNFLKHSNFFTYHPHQYNLHKSNIDDFTFVQNKQAM